MRNRKEEIKRRIARRKKMKTIQSPGFQRGTDDRPAIYPNFTDDDDSIWAKPYSPSKHSESFHPLFSKEAFLFKLLASACLVLVVAILFKSPSKNFEPIRQTVANVMEHEFQFAAVSKWYEDTFGQPLALLPQENKTDDQSLKEYAMPANAKILENFTSENQGVTIQTEKDTPVEAVMDGVVKFAGVTEDYGNTVIVLHPDNSETWYGSLQEIKVKDYERVQAGDELGIVSASENGITGEFYFAIKQDEDFIDPVQVIKFE